jgi:hypothetical protein
LLAVAVGRARRLGRGGNIADYLNSATSDFRGPIVIIDFHDERFTLSILNLGLPDVYRVLGMLKKLESYLREILDRELYRVDPKLLPLDVQLVLKETVEAVATAVLNMLKSAGDDIGALLATCDPRATEVEVSIWPESIIYYISYPCKFYMNDALKLNIALQVDRDELDESLVFQIHHAWRA